MSKVLLTFEEDYDFFLLGISCHKKDYRLCWELNKLLGFDLVRTDDLEISNKKKEIDRYSFYEYIDRENLLDYFLVSNRGDNAYLVPEHKSVDYFLMIKGSLSDIHSKRLLIKINSLDIVLTAFLINPNQLKSKQNLLL